MLLHTSHLVCRPDVVDQFRARLLRHSRTSFDAERGCHRFDVHQDRNDPTRFLLIELYDDETALDAHHHSPHYLGFRTDTADWVVGREWWFWNTLN